MNNQLSFVLFIIACYLMPTNCAWTAYLQNYYGEDVRPKSVRFSVGDSISYFSVDLMKELHRAARFDENVVFSPINVYSALASLLLGASGTTWDEIKGALRLPHNNQPRSNLDTVHAEIGELLRLIQDKNIRIGNRTVSQVTLANGIFVDDRQRIKKTFESSLRRYYNGYIKKLDFSDGYSAIDHINKWVSTETNGQIPKIFAEPLDQQSSVVEVTSVYFSGGWSERFSLQMTKIEPFNTGNDIVNVKMMNSKGRIPYLNNPSLKFESIQLDFHGRNYAAIFILPYADQTISTLLESINGNELNDILNQTTYTAVYYKIPRMKFFSSKSLKEPLRSQGLQKLFEKADLSPMLYASAQKISDIRHAVEIEVDESGAKATAVTSVRIEPLAAKNPPENGIEFYLNRQFIMLIQHRISGVILFSAVVRQPEQ